MAVRVLACLRTLVAGVLKEKGQNEKIVQSCNQSLMLDALWEQCCSDEAVVRSSCCDALVLLVEQGHADLQYAVNGILNLVPSARHTTTPPPPPPHLSLAVHFLNLQLRCDSSKVRASVPAPHP
ncbi:hypothetical protein JZ751_008617 [Albula glossodonta]|uniref:Uncharacterized protein n=1 Tax=Albula glossodonta TaxID=121402 RepID=A0A8T2NWU6_9TELE|nr:hypothetical protein JZ751_008617 [Albula glossodonta]